MANAVFDAKAARDIVNRNSAQYQEELKKYIDLTIKFTQVIKPWNELVSLARGAERMKIAEKRNEGWVSMTGIGLAILGRVGHIINRDKLSESKQDEVMKKLSEIDMRRSAEFWEGNIILDNRIVSNRLPVKLAMKKVLNHLEIGDGDLLDLIDNSTVNKVA